MRTKGKGSDWVVHPRPPSFLPKRHSASVVGKGQRRRRGKETRGEERKESKHPLCSSNLLSLVRRGGKELTEGGLSFNCFEELLLKIAAMGRREYR